MFRKRFAFRMINYTHANRIWPDGLFNTPLTPRAQAINYGRNHEQKIIKEDEVLLIQNRLWMRRKYFSGTQNSFKEYKRIGRIHQECFVVNGEYADRNKIKPTSVTFRPEQKNSDLYDRMNIKTISRCSPFKYIITLFLFCKIMYQFLSILT